MAQKKIPKKLISIVNEYIRILKEDNLPIKKVILFGSYAKGTQNKWSDVDICIISPQFNKPYNAMQYLVQKVNFNIKYSIEPLGFTPHDFNQDSTLINEIKKGIEIPF